MRITLNLATRPFADLGPAIKRLRIGIGVLALLSCCLGLGLRAFHQQAEEARAREHSLDAQIAAVNQERQGYEAAMRQPANVEVLAKAGTLNQLFDEKTFSWTLAMEDLETVLPGGVQVSTLEPVRGKDGVITLHLRVIGPRNKAVELVENLEHSRRFLLPRIVGENAESTGGPGERMEPVSASNRVNFDLLANYNPATPAEAKAAAKAEKPPPEKAQKPAKPSAAPRSASPLPFHPAPAQGPGRAPYTGAARPPYMPNAKPHAGGPQ
jgi:type IV pilus assembly protein PilN